MRILALIAARGGSRRVPRKNIRILGARPLLAWSVDVVKGLAHICDILVSTDDPEIAGVARQEGALVPWLRPAKLATDTASSVDVCLHALEWYEGEKGAIDGLMLLQPTSPFRRRATVNRGIDLFGVSSHRSVVGVSPARSHPMWCYRVEAETLQSYMGRANVNLRSQDLPPAYVVNGGFYLIAPRELRATNSLIGTDTMPLVIDDPSEGLDIDSEWDWKIAEAIVAMGDVVSR